MEEYNDFIGPTPDQPPNDYDQYNRRHQQYSRSHSEEEEQIECNSQNFFAISAIFRMFFLVIKRFKYTKNRLNNITNRSLR